jgi:hypothetical protein
LLGPSVVTEIAYAAFTETATFMLDADGICRWVVPASSAGRSTTFSKDLDSSERCVGAQYVASIDALVQGGLVELPRVGASLVFAVVDASGRISLIRTGALLRFEVKRKPDSGIHERPTPLGPLATAHSLPTMDGDDVEEPELKTMRFRPETMLKGMLPRPAGPPRPAAPPPRTASVMTKGPLPPIPMPSSLRGVRPGKLPPPAPPPRRGQVPPPPPSTTRSYEPPELEKPMFGGLAPREENEVRKVPVPASYWSGRRSGRTRRQA